MLVFVINNEEPGEIPSKQGSKQQLNRPTYGAGSRIWTRATFVEACLLYDDFEKPFSSLYNLLTFCLLLKLKTALKDKYKHE